MRVTCEERIPPPTSEEVELELRTGLRLTPELSRIVKGRPKASDPESKSSVRPGGQQMMLVRTNSRVGRDGIVSARAVWALASLGQKRERRPAVRAGQDAVRHRRHGHAVTTERSADAPGRPGALDLYRAKNPACAQPSSYGASKSGWIRMCRIRQTPSWR